MKQVSALRMHLIWVGILFSITCFAQDSLYILKNVTIIDGTGSTEHERKSILVSGGRIAAIDDFKQFSDTIPSADLEGYFAIPGLYDSHVHLSEKKYGTNRLADQLAHALFGGITGLRDMGSDARVLAYYSRLARLGMIKAPDIFFSALIAGPNWVKDPRYGASTMGADLGETPWMPIVTDTTDVRKLVTQIKGTGATGIKLYIDLDAQTCDDLIKEAQSQNLKTWAHPYINPATGNDLIDSGIDVLSHSGHAILEIKGMEKYRSDRKGFWKYEANSLIVRRLFEKMAAKNILLEPTVFVYDVVDELMSTRKSGYSTLEAAVQITKEAYQLGVEMVAGTDTLSDFRNDPFPHIHKELKLMVDSCGIAPTDAIKFATLNAAITLGIEEDYGTIERGKVANLVVLRKDPLEDIRNTTSIVYVIKNGKVHLRE